MYYIVQNEYCSTFVDSTPYGYLYPFGGGNLKPLISNEMRINKFNAK